MISLCSWQLAGRVDVIAAVAEWGLDIVIPATTEAVTVTRTCSSPSSFSHSVHLKMMESYHKMSRLGKASSVLSTGAFPKMSSHTKLVSPTQQLIPSASSYAFQSAMEIPDTRLMRNSSQIDGCQIAWPPDFLSRHILWALGMLWVWSAAELWVPQASLPDPCLIWFEIHLIPTPKPWLHIKQKYIIIQKWVIQNKLLDDIKAHSESSRYGVYKDPLLDDSQPRSESSIFRWYKSSRFHPLLRRKQVFIV